MLWRHYTKASSNRRIIVSCSDVITARSNTSRPRGRSATGRAGCGVRQEIIKGLARYLNKTTPEGESGAVSDGSPPD